MFWQHWFSTDDTGAAQDSDMESTISEIEILCERIASSTLLDDKIKALEHIHSMAPKYRLEIGTRAMDTVIDMINKYGTNSHIVQLSLEIIGAILQFDDALSPQENTYSDISDRRLCDSFGEIMMKTDQSVRTLLSLIDHSNYRIRMAVLKIFFSLARSDTFRLITVLSSIHFSIVRILDFCDDSSEVIKLHGVILIETLSQYSHVQDMLAFQNIFVRMINIVNDQGVYENHALAYHCFKVIYNVLNQNETTQKKFVEDRCFSGISPFLVFSEENLNDSSFWDQGKSSAIGVLFEVVHLFVNPFSQKNLISSCQDLIETAGIFSSLLRLLTSSAFPQSIKVELVGTLAETMRGKDKSQKEFSNHIHTTLGFTDPLTYIFEAILSPTNIIEFKQMMVYLFKCYLYSNISGYSKINSLFEKGMDSTDVDSPMQLLWSGLFDTDKSMLWASCSILTYVICNLPDTKVILAKASFLRKGASASQIDHKVSMLHEILIMLKSESTPFKAKFYVLCFLLMWMAEYPPMIDQFFDVDNAISIPVYGLKEPLPDSQRILSLLCAALLAVFILYSPKERNRHYCTVVTAYVNIDIIKNMVSQLVRDPCFVACSLSPRPTYISGLHFDFEFVTLVKKIEVALLDRHNDENKNSRSSPSPTDELIKIKDAQINELILKCKNLEETVDSLKRELKQGYIDSNSSAYSQNYNDLSRSYSILNSAYIDIRDRLNQRTNEVYELKKIINELKRMEGNMIPATNYDSSNIYSPFFYPQNNNYPQHVSIYLPTNQDPSYSQIPPESYNLSENNIPQTYNLPSNDNKLYDPTQ